MGWPVSKAGQRREDGGGAEEEGSVQRLIPVMSDFAGNGDIQWCFSQVKGTLDDDVSEGEYYWRCVCVPV